MANFKQIEAHEKIEKFKIFENLLGYFTPYKKAFGILFLIMFIATILQAFLLFIGQVDIIVKDRRLIERLFDNIKFKTK